MDLQNIRLQEFKNRQRIELYTAIIVATGSGVCKIDAGEYTFTGPIVIFISPFQTLQITSNSKEHVQMLQFHGDFYCIEFHTPEVACNGLLFNNVYLSPVLKISKEDLRGIDTLLANISTELKTKPVDQSVMVSYLQLFLALTSRMKRKDQKIENRSKQDFEMEKLKLLIDQHFSSKRKPADYAKMLGFTPNNLAKRSAKYFSKSPSELIQERIVLEAKKKLHLTRQSVKEIAFSLQFEDEHYFSRFFKKAVGVSPQAFRRKAGISKVAYLST